MSERDEPVGDGAEVTPTNLVVFTPSGRQGRVEDGTTVLDAARGLGVDLDSICGGRGVCGRCQVRLGSSKDVPLDPRRLSPPGPSETDYRGRRPLAEGHRLGCAARIVGDVVIDIPEESQVRRQVVRKRAEVRDFVVDPVVRLHYVEPAQGALGEAGSLETRLLAALEDEWALNDLTVHSKALPGLQAGLSRSPGVTAVVRDGSQVVDVWPGFFDRAFGIAFDVGSTTIAGHLCHLLTGEIIGSLGVMNPQIRFGEDVMSRVSYAMMNGPTELTDAVRAAVNRAVSELMEGAGVEPREVLELAFVANPIMHHIFLGLDPTPLGSAPFQLAVDSAVEAAAGELGVTGISDVARAYLLPCVAGHVGADAAGAMLSEGPHRSDRLQLLVDVGTNAEIVLGDSNRVLAASSPTGPAFEGAQISSGQRAGPGAIERVRIDPGSLEPRIKLVGAEHWSDETGFDDEVAETPITGVCGSGIIEAIAELYLAGVVTKDGIIESRPGGSGRIVPSGRTWDYLLWSEPRILVTQADVRAVQLAKAALQAGARLLMGRLGVSSVGEVRLAGGFGNHIDPKYAMVLGMIPDCDLDRVSGAGNAAGTGAVMALLSRAARSEVEQLVRDVEKVETATEPDFQEHFVASLAFPHATDPYPRLREIVDLPEPRPATSRRARSRRG